jgi:chemotaxis protein histidine kinase CheA
MSTFSIIQQKLEQFIKKYYTNELIKGAILFFAIGLLYFLVTLLVEYFLWLSPLGRTVLFWTFVGVEAGLFIRFIALPLTKIFKLQQGISHEEASKIIGSHFPQVNDKLLNIIQLNQNQRESELLLASINQKAGEIQPVPFKGAINFSKNAKYLKYAAIPIVIFVLVSVLGDEDTFTSSYERVVNYDTAYEPPADFSFYVVNEDLSAIENKNYTLKVRTDGDIIPENASISYNNETYYLQQSAPGYFEYTFLQPSETIGFQLRGNKVVSKEYTLDVIKTPSLLSFEMVLDYPGYTGKTDEVLKSTGNATVPEGTRVVWNVNTKNTKSVALKTSDSTYQFTEKDQQFNFRKGVYRKLDYAITTSNEQLKDYENLSYSINVIRDEYPEIDVQSKQDSLKSQVAYFFGRVSDDYGLTKLQLVYYQQGQEDQLKKIPLSLNKTNFDQFTYSFPSNLDLTDGIAYEYYFEVFDNDAIHKYKSSKSTIFSFRKLTQDELENEQLEDQDNSIRALDKTLEELKEQEKTLEEISKTQKEKNELSWNDKKKLENFIKRQKQQEEMMKKFSKEMKENLENFQPENEEKDPFKEQLEKRIEENEEKLKENEKLLDELEKLQEKIEKEELGEKLEKLSKQNKNQEKNLEQLLELTKRYYVAKKAERLAEELYKLGEEQEKLADEPEEKNTKEEQEKLNEKFQDYQKEKEKLDEDNDKLKKPMDIPDEESEEKQVEEEQKKATDSLEEKKNGDAKGSQKKAGKKMKQIGKKMQVQMQGGGMETMEEDVEMLRQILDNLVVFSFEQETLMKEFKTIDYGNALFGKKLNFQNDLKLNFQHIDDSLFGLSLRQPMISAPIIEGLTEVQYNIDKSLDRLAQNQFNLGVSSQQYIVTGANELAVLLSDLLNNMQMQMQMPGKGSGKGGKGFQLPDIIKKQEGLSEKMKEGMEKGKQGKKGKGEGEEEGEGEGEGKGEGEGEGEGDGKGDGKGEGKDGENGRDGKNGDGEGDNEDMNGELFEIYKQQQQLRQQLEDRLSKEGLNGNGGDLLRQMEGIEQQLLDKGFNERTLERMLNLQYELLKLDKADFEQGQETKRESKTNRNAYRNKLRLSPEDIKKYFNTIEILNREALPLRQEYKEKVQTYFKSRND